jgi:hypothetical protein
LAGPEDSQTFGLVDLTSPNLRPRQNENYWLAQIRTGKPTLFRPFKRVRPMIRCGIATWSGALKAVGNGRADQVGLI